MGEFVFNIGFWADYNPGSPPTGKLIARRHRASPAADDSYDVSASETAIKSAVADDDEAAFAAEMSAYLWWSGLPAGHKAAFWYSALVRNLSWVGSYMTSLYL